VVIVNGMQRIIEQQQRQKFYEIGHSYLANILNLFPAKKFF
jgi:hypothetical protein